MTTESLSGPVHTFCFCCAALGLTKACQKQNVSRKIFKIVQQAFKFNKVCNASCLWHGTDSNIVLLPCQTKLINFDISFQKCNINFFLVPFAADVKSCFCHLLLCLCWNQFYYYKLLSLTQPKLDVCTWPQSKIFNNEAVLLSWHCIDTLLSC